MYNIIVIIFFILTFITATACDSNTSLFDAKIGSNVNGWKVERTIHNKRLNGTLYDSYVFLSGDLGSVNKIITI